jgi:hypothetical protein
MSASARRRAEVEFDAQRTFESVRQLYQQLCHAGA